MRAGFLRLFAVLTVGFLGSCQGGPHSEDGEDGVDTGGDVPFGEPCAEDAECNGGACLSGGCTRECAEYEDCPDGYRCADSGIAGDGRVLCVASTYLDGIGENCTFDQNACAEGLRCYYRSVDDPDAFCSTNCASAIDCPPGFVCIGTIENPTEHCRLPSFCDPCAVDDDCGDGGRCLVDNQGARFCSVVCTYGTATCPAGGVCEQIEGGEAVCRPATGACGPTGDLCSTCETDDDCNSGGYCLRDTYSNGIFCGTPCTGQADCPDEHFCNANAQLAGGGLAPDSQCYPRTGDCGDPSRGGMMCEFCEGLADCYNGYCLQGGLGCGENCAANVGGESVCPPFSECKKYTLTSGEPIFNCVPANSNPCYMWAQCLEDYGRGNCSAEDECISGDCTGS